MGAGPGLPVHPGPVSARADLLPDSSTPDSITMDAAHFAAVEAPTKMAQLYQRPHAVTILAHGAAATERMRSGVSVSQFQVAQQRSRMVS